MDDSVGTRDMTTLSNLTVESINHNLKIRYDSDLVYTYTGTILISVNPYKPLTIYGTDNITHYHENSEVRGCPHIYAIAEQSYNSLIRSYNETTNTTDNQSIVISGESGAGKTETTKFILQYLCHVTSNVSTWVENQILEANTILEAFGNAKTVRNDNSSRFGKFMQVCFDSKWMIRGCIIQDYLLEQSRITFQSQDERNYHVFYQLINAAKKSTELNDTYLLDQQSTPPLKFSYLENADSSTSSLDPLLLALQVLQIEQSHINGLFSTLSCILHLGNMEFNECQENENALLTTSDKLILSKISKLLNLEESCLESVLLTRQINVRGNITEIPLRVNEACENRHAMSKALYSKCFRWLICHINERTNPGQDSSKVIGLLDIFGFENFKHNSFEQLCINYANEKLHRFFNQAVFQIEQEIYKSEGLNISEIKYTDNDNVLELLEKPPRCVMKLLTEQCHLPKGSDLGFLNNLHSDFGSHACYEKGEDRRIWDKSFIVKHYAGSVIYTVNGFVDKNRDVQQDLLFNVLSDSKIDFLVNLDTFEHSSSTLHKNTSNRRPTVAEHFRNQLNALVDVLINSTPWYVRCVKPNETKTPNSYNDTLVLEQLNYLGMLEIINIRKHGYPIHVLFKEFADRFKVIGKFKTYKAPKDVAMEILESVKGELGAGMVLSSAPKSMYIKPSVVNYYFQVGETRVFMKPEMSELLESKRLTIITRHVVKIQSCYRGYKNRSEYKRKYACCVTVQRAYRSWKSRISFIRKRRAAITIQAYIRGFFAREVSAALREMRKLEDELRKRDETNNMSQDVSLQNLYQFLSEDNLDNICFNMDELVKDLSNIRSSESESSISNFEFESEFDDDSTTPTVIPSPPPLLPPPDNITARLPEPKEKPPPPPVFQSSNEPIYESIQPRIIAEPIIVTNVVKPPQEIRTAAVIKPPEPRPQVIKPPIEYRAPPPLQPPEPRPVQEHRPVKLPESPVIKPPQEYRQAIIKPPQEYRVPAPIEYRAPPPPQHRPPPPEDTKPRENLLPRVEKRVNEIINQKQEETVLLRFEDYAAAYFMLETKKPSQCLSDYITEQTSYTKSSITHPHTHLYDPVNVNTTVTLFKDLLKYMKGELKPEVEVTGIQNIIGYGIDKEELRDEIYVCVLRLINRNAHAEYVERLYVLFCLCIVSFPPGKVLCKVILHELNSTTHESHKLKSQVKWILENIENLKLRGYVRKLPPSSVEIQAMKRLGTIVCRFFFLDGRTKAIDIHPTDTAQHAILKLAEKIGVSYPERLIDNGWAIYQVRPNERIEEHVPLNYYIYDVIALWEISNTVDKNVSLGCGDNRFVFKKRLFKGNSREIPQDPIECSLLYAQAVFNVVKRDDYPVAEKVSLQLSGLQCQVLYGDAPDAAKLDNYSNVESYLPVRVARTRSYQQWVPILSQAHRTYGNGKSELVARVWYLSCVMQYPLYGTTMFHVVYRGYWVYGNSVVLGVSADGLSIIKNDDKFIMYEYAYNQIESVNLEVNEKLFTINLNKSLPPDTHKCFVFESNSVQEIYALVCSYCPALGKTSLSMHSNFIQLTNSDRNRLYSNVLAGRKIMIDSGVLKKPEKSLGVNFLKNTLRRLSKHKIERIKSQTFDQDYPNEWFCYSKHPVHCSFMQVNPEHEASAVFMFNNILTFSNSDQSAEHVNVIQTVVDKIWRNDELINELYFQLIKQTSEHPEPNSAVNAKYWGILALMCSLLPPTLVCVKKYLNSHLKRCAITDFVTEEGKFARFAEKCLQHTISSSSVSGTSRRQWPPSKTEILCTINRKPITARFYFMDGKYHTLQFAPNDTASDLIGSLTSKIGLAEHVKGYAIYEVSSVSTGDGSLPWERSLDDVEKPVEVLSRWERQKVNGNSQFKFMIRKHLYENLDLSNGIEKELVYAQLLVSARNDRFPVSDTEAAMLVALQAQVELGDYTHTSAGEFPDYCHVSSHCLPTRVAALVSHEAVARHHQSLVGTPPNDAKQAVLNLLMSWPLFKCIVFDVTQSFTSNWPRNLWLALDNTGLHLLPQKTRHTLCTFEFSVIKSYSPSPTCFMIVTRNADNSNANSNKIVLTTNQAYQIAQLIKRFVH